ncbi:MAG: type II toxin-antitoxin system RelE/ParE family toxin [Pseudomonadota bacterium]
MKVRILDAASRDLVDGYHFYERQQSGLGAYFIDSLFSDIDALLLYAGGHATYFGRFHRALSKRFPFAIYYRVAGQEVQVYAVLDCRRSPAWIRSHLSAAR